MVAIRTSPAGGGLNELCRAGLDATAFRRELRQHLARLVPFEAYCVNTVDPTTGLVTSSVGDGLSARDARRLFAIEERDHDFNPLGALHGACTMHDATAGRVERSLRMRRIFLPLGLGDELRAPLDAWGARWGYLHLFRGRARRPFAPDEVARIDAVRPALGHALRRAAMLKRSPSGEPAGVVLFGRGGRVRTASAPARTWLDAVGEDVGGAMPHLPMVAGLRALLDTVVVHHRTPGGAWLSAHGSRLGGGALDGGVVVVLGASTPPALRPILMRGYGLTPRERQVATLLLEGHDNASVASQLDIGLQTAKDHVKAIFRKTHTSGRAELMATFAG